MNNRYLKFYLNYIKKYKKRFITAIIFMFLYAILNASIIFVVKMVIDDIFVKAQLISEGKAINKNPINLKTFFNKGTKIINDKAKMNEPVKIESKEAIKYIVHSLIIISIIFILVYLIKGIFWYIRKYMMFYIGERVVMDLRNKIYGHIQDLSIAFFDKVKTGEIMSRITNDVIYIQRAISGAGTQVIQEPLNLIFALAILFYLNWQITSFSLIIIIILIIPVSILSKKMKKATKVSQVKIADLSSIMQEIINGARVVKAFNMEEHEKDKFKQINREYFNAMMKGNRAWALLTPTNEFLSSLAIAAAIIIGGLLIIQGKMTTGSFFAYFFALFSVYRPTRTLTEAYATYKKSHPVVDRINEVINEHISIKEIENPVKIKDFKNKIIFKNLWFSYNHKDWVLQNIDLTVRKGQNIAIVGESGGGKSTIGALLLRFYDSDKGTIIIDGRDIKNYSVRDLRSIIGYVSQEPFLFNDTIYNNIAYGNMNVKKDAIIEAAKASNSYDFIEQLPQGFDTIVGERGYSLSGGQRQRIAIARALIKNPHILILDEATSALDSESEKIVQDALEILMKGRTNIIIAHRLSTIKNSDIIFVLSKGNIIETGTHNDLLAKKGKYFHLYNII
ncbi:ABC transporter ATP-binding protein [bacterium]|nr:ABC transporter ATP-binding protein [bacterium]